ncbi:MAG TPA: haloacid dehalogenase [Acidimicrobiia bacterium]|nr:haloacid dehalogenase [Acidimicrobiia bacterium]
MGPDRSRELRAAGTAARTELERRHQAREVTLPLCRRAIRASALAIRAVHRGDLDDGRARIREAAELLAEAGAATERHPAIRDAGYVHDAQKEYAEACLTLAYVAHEDAPDAATLEVDIPAYLNGMAEAASELRRQVLDRLRDGDTHEAETLFAAMDDVYDLLVTVDYPDALTGGLRRSTDALRAVLERTRGDITNAIVLTRFDRTVSGDPPRAAS